MKILHISIADKRATFAKRDGEIICSNSDYKVAFTFDDEWSGVTEKTARFIWDGQHYDVPITGTECNVPRIKDADKVEVGVYAGELHTTTGAEIPCQRSILSGGTTMRPEQSAEYRDQAVEAAERAEAAAQTAAADAAVAAAEELERRVSGVIVQGMGDSTTAVMSQKTTSEHLKKIRTTNNLFSDAELVEGYYYSSKQGDAYIAPSYNYFKGVVLEAGTYTIYPKARFVCNMSTGAELGDHTKTFTVTEKSEYNITVYAADTDWKLFKSEYTVAEVRPYGEYAFNKDIKFEHEIPITQTGLVESKNLLTGVTLKEGYYYSSSQGKDAAADKYNYFKGVVLEAGTYTIYPEARFVCNMITGAELGDHTKTFTVTEKSEYNITVYASNGDWKLFKSEYTAAEVEPWGSYSLRENILTATSGILTGKKWCACGDSFTVAGYTGSEGIPESEYKFQEGPYKGKQIVYPYIIGLRNDMEVVNLAVGGMTMCNIDGTRDNSFTKNTYLNIPTDADYITLKFGINDANYNSPVGSIDDEVVTTFYGAWNVALRHILTTCPFAKVGIIVTNGSRQEYTDATLAIAKKWGIAYIDEVNDPTVPLLHRVERAGVSSEVKQLRLQAFRVSESNTHPNVKAHYYEASFIENWLKSL